MSIKRHLHLLRAVAPLVLLLLAACSDKAQVANTTQQVLDAKNPGVVGAITNAVGTSTGNPEVDAAIGATAVIKKMEESDKLIGEARAAAGKDDLATADAKIAAVEKLYPNNEFVEMTSLNSALQCGADPATVASRTTKLVSGIQYEELDVSYQSESERKNQATLLIAADETEQVLRKLNTMNLPKKEIRRRQAVTAGVLVDLHTRAAKLYADAGKVYVASDERAKADRYRQMQQELQAQIAGEL